jgi:phospholipid/cholesterol/gamma-HCH transport system substrate-binding protein
MRGITTELKVGIFAIMVIAILTFMTFKSSDFELMKKDGYIVYAEFKNIAGLDEKTKVKIAGVDTGVIEGITLKNGLARLRLRINRDVRLYSDASAAVKATGLLGDKYLSVNIGSKEPVLREGDTIKYAAEVTDIDDMARNLSNVSANINKLAQSLNESLGSEEAKQSLKETILNLRDITANINTAIVHNDKRFRDVLVTVNEMTTSIKDLVQNNKESVSVAMTNFKDFSANIKSDGPALITNLNNATKELKSLVEDNRSSIKSTTESIENIAKKIDSGEGTIGKLVKDDKLYDSLNKAAEGVNKTISSIDRFRTYLTMQGDYLTKPKEGKGYFYVTLQPRPEKYYILGVVSDPIGKVSTIETTTTVNGMTTIETRAEIEKKIEFTAQIAKRFTESAMFRNTVVRGGITESTFGVGVDQFLMNDRVKLSVDAWDFGNNETESKNPHVRAGADFFIFKNLFISGGVDNIFNKKWSGVYVGGGVRFEDEDFKYIFGTMPKIPSQ